jgi:chromosome segregation ATPase
MNKEHKQEIDILKSKLQDQIHKARLLEQANVRLEEDLEKKIKEKQSHFNAEIKVAKDLIETLKKKSVEDVEKETAKWSAEIKKFEHKMKRLQEEAEAASQLSAMLKIQLDSEAKKVSELLKEKEVFQVRIEKYESQVSTMKVNWGKKDTELKQAIDKSQKQLHQKESEIAAIRKEVEQKEKELKEFRKLEASEKKFESELEEKILELEKQLEERDTLLMSTEKRLEEQLMLTDTEKHVEVQLAKQLDASYELQRKLEARLQEYHQKFEELKQESAQSKLEYEELAGVKRELEKEIEEEKKRTRHYQQQLQENIQKV